MDVALICEDVYQFVSAKPFYSTMEIKIVLVHELLLNFNVTDKFNNLFKKLPNMTFKLTAFFLFTFNCFLQCFVRKTQQF